MVPTETVPTEIEHAETGAPDPEQLEQSVEALGGAPVEETAPLFSDFDVHPDVVAALADAGITRTFAIQELTLPLALAGHDLIGQARTGTGKTLGFGVPMLQRVVPPAEGGDGVPQALVVVPTRELCVQVSRDLATAGAKRGVRVQAIYGGRAFEPQVESLQKGVEIVVGTPGRLLDLAGQRLLSLKDVSEMVLDEADKMLDLGFLPDVEKLFAQTSPSRHTMLFSATMPGPVVALARRFMNRPIHIRATDPDEGLTQANIKHVVYRAHSLDKDEVISRILQAEGRGKTVIFTRTKRAAAKLVEELNDRGFNAGAVHGDMSQDARERSMASFKAGKRDILIATDVAARGIDVNDVTHVINHTVPDDADTYLHRAGRTGRAGKTGIAVTFVDWDDMHKWRLIDRGLDMGIPEPTETYSSSPHLYAELDIPEGTKGRLKPAAPAAERPPRQSSGARSGGPGSGDRTRSRRRTRGGAGGSGSGGAQSATSRPEGAGTHDGKGTEHHDGNAAPAKRRRRRRSGGATGAPTPPPAG
jgi:superfamily II DNA/RNA helicase